MVRDEICHLLSISYNLSGSYRIKLNYLFHKFKFAELFGNVKSRLFRFGRRPREITACFALTDYSDKDFRAKHRQLSEFCRTLSTRL